MHKKCVWRPGSARTRWESLQRSPRLPSWIQGVLLLGGGRGKKGKGEGKGKGRGGEGREGGEECAQFCIQIWGDRSPCVTRTVKTKILYKFFRSSAKRWVYDNLLCHLLLSPASRSWLRYGRCHSLAFANASFLLLFYDPTSSLLLCHVTVSGSCLKMCSIRLRLRCWTLVVGVVNLVKCPD